ncbi:hypothetical protein MP228_012302 [Amoeboaphelidium protococcarum]|nr:hypothetical protein MP228_012302 [Amoeboaphelidium protococcarum]
MFIAYLQELEMNYGRSYIFQQDNAPCHTAKTVKECMANNHINLLEDELGAKGKWPAASPDLSPIENAWAICKQQRQSRYGIPKSRQDLVQQFQTVWRDLPSSLAAN